MKNRYNVKKFKSSLQDLEEFNNLKDWNTPKGSMLSKVFIEVFKLSSSFEVYDVLKSDTFLKFNSVEFIDCNR